MASIKIDGHIYAKRCPVFDKWDYTFSIYDMAEIGYMQVGPLSIDYELPDSFSPEVAEVLLLNKQLDNLNEEFRAKSNKIMDKIAQLQADETKEAA